MEQTDITTRGTLKDTAAVNTDITQNVKSYIVMTDRNNTNRSSNHGECQISNIKSH